MINVLCDILIMFDITLLLGFMQINFTIHIYFSTVSLTLISCIATFYKSYAYSIISIFDSFSTSILLFMVPKTV